MTLDDILSIDDAPPAPLDYEALKRRMKLRAMIPRGKGRRSGAVAPDDTLFVQFKAPDGPYLNILFKSPDGQYQAIAFGASSNG